MLGSTPFTDLGKRRVVLFAVSMPLSATDLAGLAVLLLLFFFGVLTGALTVRIGTPPRKGNGAGTESKDGVTELVTLVIEKVLRELRSPQTGEAEKQTQPPARRKWFGRR